MATIATIKNEIHRANCAELDTLYSEAQSLLAANPSLENYFRIHVFKEYNRRKFNLCDGVGMLTPFDGGLKPMGLILSTIDTILLEDGTEILLEDGTALLLE